MSHLPTIITDLAMILLVAGVTTILFKKINQPLVLGYIIAGFITGPNFVFFPTVADKVNVQAWSEIGVIFLLFALGLEFSFYKLKKVGSTAFVSTAVIIFSMLFVGYGVGQLLGWSHMDSIFLGGMLSMSSTAIIIKAFDDLQLREKSFTEVVFGVLIVEDIIDTGRTLAEGNLIASLLDKGAADVKLCSLLDKPSRRTHPVTIDFKGYEIENLFVVGYGLDYNGFYRNLPYIGYFPDTKD